MLSLFESFFTPYIVHYVKMSRKIKCLNVQRNEISACVQFL